MTDTDGTNASLNQPDDVWFLAGSFGTRVERRCSVPGDRPLFVPLFNMWHQSQEGPPPAVPSAFGSLRVDGVQAKPEVIFTPRPFMVSGAFLNPVTRRRRTVPMTVWGLWSHLAPLPTGQHQVEIKGGDGHGFIVEVTYRLEVL